MLTARLTQKIALLAGSAAIIGMGALTACSSEAKDKPAETKAPATQSKANAPAPTEKKAGPGDNNLSFTPTVKAKPAPTALPGNVITGN